MFNNVCMFLQLYNTKPRELIVTPMVGMRKQNVLSFTRIITNNNGSHTPNRRLLMLQGECFDIE